MSTPSESWAEVNRMIEAMGAERDALRATLDASERANADCKAFLHTLRLKHDLDVPEEVWSALFSTDAGRDYVPKSKVDAAIHLLRDAEDALSNSYDVREWPAEPDCRAWRTRDAIREFLAARDAGKESVK